MNYFLHKQGSSAELRFRLILESTYAYRDCQGIRIEKNTLSSPIRERQGILYEVGFFKRTVRSPTQKHGRLLRGSLRPVF